MSNEHPTTDIPETTDGASKRAWRRRGKVFFALSLFGAMAVGAMAFAGARGKASFGPHGHGFHHGPHGAFADDPELMRDMAGVFVDRALTRIEATDDQRAEIDAILDRAVPTMFAHKQEKEALHERFAALMDSDKELDPEAVELLRSEGIALADRATGDAMDLFLELRAVLTPDQRAELRELMESRRSRWGR